MIIDRQELSNILGVTSEGIKTIEKRKQLENRLKDKGYKLISKYKEGRKVYYNIEYINNNLKETYNNMTNYIYKTRKEEEFSRYFTIRTKGDIIHNKKDIANISSVGVSTVTKWDNILINNDIICQDGYFYFYLDDEKNIIQCQEMEYKTFWKNKAYLKAFKDLQHKYNLGQITLTELQLSSAEIGAYIQATENKYYYRIKKYKTKEDNKLYLDTSELIKLIYGFGESDKVYSNDINNLLN